MMDPIEWAAHKFAVWLKNVNPGIQAETDAIRYGAAYYLNYYGVIVISMTASFILHNVSGTVLSLIAIALLRRYTGGYHFPSLTLCAVFTIFLVNIIPLIPLSSYPIIHLLNLQTLLIIMTRPHLHTHRKCMALALATTNLWFGSAVVALAFYVQALSLIIPIARKVVKPDETTIN